MKTTKEFINEINPSSVIIRILIGAAIGLAVISVLVFNVNDPDPAWGVNWRIKPLILTPLVSGIGFLSFYLKDYIMPKSDAGKIIVFLISVFAFIVSLWMGTIIGLDGTLWN